MPLPSRNGETCEAGPDSCILHIGMLSFHPSSTPHEPTRAKTCLELVDSILTFGFLTKHEPLLLCSGGEVRVQELQELGVDPAWTNLLEASVTIPPLSIGHHKSAARAITLHLILSLFMDDKVDVQKAHPTLWQSVREITCADMVFKGAKEEIFSTFNLSHRGAIRRPPKVISWCVALSKLATKGETDSASIIRAWNMQSVNSAQIAGQKMLGVKNLMELCDDRTKTVIIDCVSKYGWEHCPFSDDAFSSKKLYPGVHWRSKTSKAASPRMTATKESMYNLFRHIVAYHAITPTSRRKKMTKPVLEEKARMATFATALFHEAVEAGLNHTVLYEKWLEPWILANDLKLDMEFTQCMLGNTDNLTICDLPSLRMLLDQKALQHNPVLEGDARLVRIKGEDLEESTFNLLIKKIEYDCNTWKVYKQNVERWEHRVQRKALIQHPFSN